MKDLKHLLVLVAVLVATCVAGTMDYHEEVMCHMSNGTYEALRERLGDVSTSELVEAYMENQEYWDEVGSWEE